MKYLFILNDPPYGTERSYGALRLLRELLKDPAAGNEAKIFLVGDAASCAKGGQKVPPGYYSIEALLHGVTARSVPTLLDFSRQPVFGLGVSAARLLP